MKRIMIVGAGSYIGTSFETYVRDCVESGNYEIGTLDAVGLQPHKEMFKNYDTVLYVAGIVHRRETKRNARLYYKVNRDLAVAVAEAARNAGVGQFILLSTMSVYGQRRHCIGKRTVPHPITNYGKSKLQADQRIWKMRGRNFRVAVMRPPMVYGKGCRGNYQSLRKLAVKTPIFPRTDNRRSMVYIGNLCEFIKEAVDKEKQGLFFPQDGRYVNTSELVVAVAGCHGKKVRLVRGFGWMGKLPYGICRNVFGSLLYEKTDIAGKYSFVEAVHMTEEGT